MMGRAVQGGGMRMGIHFEIIVNSSQETALTGVSSLTPHIKIAVRDFAT